MFHPFRCPKCGGETKNTSWFCPYCESSLGDIYTKKQKPHCFIATAAYGTPWHKDIDVLRDFRDDVLDKNIFGRTFIKFYYFFSPPIALCVAKNNSLKMITRKLIKICLKIIKK